MGSSAKRFPNARGANTGEESMAIRRKKKSKRSRGKKEREDVKGEKKSYSIFKESFDPLTFDYEGMMSEGWR